MSGDDLHSLPIFVYQVKCFAPVQNKDLAWGTKTTSSCKESNLSVCSGQSYIMYLYGTLNIIAIYYTYALLLADHLDAF